jgi:hypothetical protein
LLAPAALLPTFLVGPLLGVLGVWYRDHGDIPQPLKQVTGDLPPSMHRVLHKMLQPRRQR